VKNFPDSIRNYLKKIDADQSVDGYLCLNDEQEIVANYGCIGVTNINDIDCAINVVQLFPVLEGLLPGNYAVPTVINYAHIDPDHYFDIHLFHDNLGFWVLFINKTSFAKKMQKEQQIRLTDDFKNDSCRSGN